MKRELGTLLHGTNMRVEAYKNRGVCVRQDHLVVLYRPLTQSHDGELWMSHIQERK